MHSALISKPAVSIKMTYSLAEKKTNITNTTYTHFIVLLYASELNPIAIPFILSHHNHHNVIIHLLFIFLFTLLFDGADVPLPPPLYVLFRASLKNLKKKKTGKTRTQRYHAHTSLI